MDKEKEIKKGDNLNFYLFFGFVLLISSAVSYYFNNWFGVVIVFIASFVGYITNWLVIKFLFHPRNEINLGIFKLHGVIPARKKDLAKKVGEVVEADLLGENFLENINYKELLEDVLTADKIAKILSNVENLLRENEKEVKSILEDMYEKFLLEGLDEDRINVIKKKLLSLSVGEKIFDAVYSFLRKEETKIKIEIYLKKFIRNNIVKLSNDESFIIQIKYLLLDKVNSFLTYERINEVLKKLFEEEVMVKILDELVQFLRENKREVLDYLKSAVKNYLVRNDLKEKLIKYMESDKFLLLIEKFVQSIDTEELINKILDEIKKKFSEKNELVGFFSDIVGEVLDSMFDVRKKLKNLIEENLNKDSIQKLLVDKVKENIDNTSIMNFIEENLLSYDLLEEFYAQFSVNFEKFLKDKFLFNVSGKAIILGKLSNFVNNNKEKIFLNLFEFFSKVENRNLILENILQVLDEMLTENNIVDKLYEFLESKKKYFIEKIDEKIKEFVNYETVKKLIIIFKPAVINSITTDKILTVVEKIIYWLRDKVLNLRKEEIANILVKRMQIIDSEKLMKKLKIKEKIEEKVANMDDEMLEKQVIEKVMGQELELAVWAGIPVGAIAGMLQVLIKYYLKIS